MSFGSEPLISIWGNVGPELYGLSRHHAYIIGDHGGSVAMMPCPESLGGGSPLAAFSYELDVAVVASSEGSVLCYSITEQSIAWQLERGSLVRKLIILPASRAVIISGDETMIVSIDDGSPMDSALLGYHSHTSTGTGCLCVKRTAPQLHYFDAVKSKGQPLQSPSTRVRLVCECGDLLACALFEHSGEVTIFNRRTGTVVSEINIPDCSLIDAFGQDTHSQVFFALVHRESSKRLEVWKLGADGQASLLSQLPEGIGQVGWTFHENSTHLVSRIGRLVVVSTGALLRSQWNSSNLLP